MKGRKRKNETEWQNERTTKKKKQKNIISTKKIAIKKNESLYKLIGLQEKRKLFVSLFLIWVYKKKEEKNPF